MRRAWIVRFAAFTLVCGAFVGIWLLRRSERTESRQELSARIAEMETASALREARIQAASEKKLAEAERATRVAKSELRDASNRLEKAYKDIGEMEKQLVDVSRAKNDIEALLAELQAEIDRWRDRGIEIDTPAMAPAIDGVVLGVSDKVNLVLISVGGKDKVKTGVEFTVTREREYVSKLVVDKVEDGWAACREIVESREVAIKEGDSVSTRGIEVPPQLK
ncbi:MAG: hypothetical protein K8T20_15475 [Planctomycetes bacterium]|nr:hypothetical protein [Planctomycetota bacterium]